MMKIGIQVHMDNRCWENENGKVSKKKKKKKRVPKAVCYVLSEYFGFQQKS